MLGPNVDLISHLLLTVPPQYAPQNQPDSRREEGDEGN